MEVNNADYHGKENEKFCYKAAIVSRLFQIYARRCN